MTWGEYFFGDPRRTLRILAVIAIIVIVVIGMVNPHLLHLAMYRIWIAFKPIIEVSVVIGFALAALGLMIRPIAGGGGKKG